jgi:DNA-binding MarR family transcriptional regulator
MTKLIQRLESKGFVKCFPSDRDHRYKKITCTEKSAGIYKMILAQDAEVFSELCSNLTDEQKEELTQLADMILNNIDSL